MVEAVFERSFYVRNAHCGLLCIGGSGIGAGPLNCVCDATADVDWRDQDVRQGLRGHFDTNRLYLDANLSFDVSSASPWAPPAFPSEWRPDKVGAGINALSMAIAQLDSVASGLMSFVFPNHPVGSSDHTYLHSAISRRAGRAVSATGNWLDGVVRQKEADIPQEMLDLVGLGQGLTPSGDDFLGGVLVALHAFEYTAARKRLADKLLRYAQGRTNAISYVHLCSAAEGQGAAVLHDMMIALCTGDREKIESILPAVDAIGHSSGWDALAGIATVLLAVCGREAQSLGPRNFAPEGNRHPGKRDSVYPGSRSYD
ncbi:MAG: DUF2877 domain-containing protein [Gammaproteobacteria bacterium]